MEELKGKQIICAFSGVHICRLEYIIHFDSWMAPMGPNPAVFSAIFKNLFLGRLSILHKVKSVEKLWLVSYIFCENLSVSMKTSLVKKKSSICAGKKDVQ